ncbi:ROK family protein [Halobacillus rhizosphaerae]|uniref:ROK family protein n=1 Tax=Halobacillus rhizosphaerae TaxID=3064889 RepID=UPI00398A9E7D
MESYIAFDFGGTYIKCAVIGENADIIESEKKPTPDSLGGLVKLIDLYVSNHPDSYGIAVSCPGAVSEDGFVYGSSAIRYNHGPNLKNIIETKTNLPVHIENDANCAGYAEVWKGAARGKENALVVVVGTGIGGAVIRNGEIYKGTHLHGGEFGFMLLTEDVQDSNDVWSRVASTQAMVRKVCRKKGLAAKELNGEQIFRMAEQGDRECLQAIDEFYHLLAVGIYNLQYLHDPEVILIGGGVSARPDLIENINKKVTKLVDKIDLAKIKPILAPCQFHHNANLLGAVYSFKVRKRRK